MAPSQIWVKNLETKEEIRKKILRKRSQIPKDEWQRSTDMISDVIISHKWFQEADNIYCYLDFNGETGTRSIIEEAWHCGKRVWVPKTEGQNMQFYAFHSYEDARPGIFGILEPRKEESADGAEGLVIVPGVAFDRERNRLGYGRGYYDRYLCVHQELRTIAAAFSVQVIEHIPCEDNDIKPQILVTEAYILGREDILCR